MLTYQGLVKGIKTVERFNKNTGETWNEYYLGLSSPKAGGYEGEQIIQDFKITKKQNQNNLADYYKGLIGKQINVQIYINNRIYNDRIYSDWFLSEAGLPISVDGKPPQAVKAA